MRDNRQVITAKTGVTSLNPGQFAYLDNQDSVLQITQGSVEVYAIKNADSWHPQKVFLFESIQGKFLFGVPPQEIVDLRFMITTPHGAILNTITKSDLLADGGEHTLKTCRLMLEEWLEMLLSALLSDTKPLAFVPIKSGETITVKENQIVRPQKHLTWVHIEEGSVNYGSMPEYLIKAPTLLPLISGGWLSARQETILSGLSAEEVFPASLINNPKAFWQPLNYCCQLAGVFINQYFLLTAAKDCVRLKEQQQEQHKLIKGAAVHLLKSQLDFSPPVVGIDSSSKAVAAIKIIADYLGVSEEIRLPTGMDSNRQDFFAFKNIANLAGMQIRRIKLENGWHLRDIGPILGNFGPEETLAVLIPLSPQKYLLYTLDGLNLEVTSDVASRISETAYIFYTALKGANISALGCLKFILQKCWKNDIWTLVLTSLIAGLVAIITPLVIKTIFEDIIPMNDRQGHLMVVQVMVVTAFSSTGIGFARNIAIVRLRSRSLLVAESAFWLRLLSLPVGFFRSYQAGDLVERMSGITQISTLLSNASVAAIFNLAFSFWSLFIMLYFSFKLSLAAILVWVVYFALSALLLWQLTSDSRLIAEVTGQATGKVLQIVNGLFKFRVKAAESQAFYLWAHKFGQQWIPYSGLIWKGDFLGILNIIQPTLISMLIFYLTVHFLQESSGNNPFITQPEFMGFTSAMGGLNTALLGLLNVLITLASIIPLSQRLKPLLDAEPETTANKASPQELSGQIEINNVTFRYLPERPPALKNISMTAYSGQFLAVVGASGSGKSTLIRLLLGFEKAENGSIYYDGQDLNELNINSVRSQMGVVLQNGQIMSGNIFDNIVGSLPLTLEDAWEAAQMVGIADDIRLMPMGMHTVISEGATNISGGQRQRILIARAIVHRPRIILFDEATSALDNKTQSIISESISRLKATRIVVAHRLSTIINADVIYVLEQGQIVESGNYQELMAQNGYFAALAKRQLF